MSNKKESGGRAESDVEKSGRQAGQIFKAGEHVKAENEKMI